MYRVVIPTAGLGTRLGTKTEHLNKALVSVNHRPVISHQISLFPETCEFVIALGYKGQLVREFLSLAYPHRTFQFVDVTPYTGEGAGLGFTLLCCKEYLQQPFVFISCDTLVQTDVPAPHFNWLGYNEVEDSKEYRTLSHQRQQVTSLNEKRSAEQSDFAYIGLAGIHDYRTFWDGMPANCAKTIKEGEVKGIRHIMHNNLSVQAIEFDWLDTGNVAALDTAQKKLKDEDGPNILEKENEAIWFVNDIVVKFSNDEEFIRNRVKRAEYLRGFVPPIIASTPNMYSYTKVKGPVLSDALTTRLFSSLLEHCKTFWKKSTLSTDELATFTKNSMDFYKEKTLNRIDLFLRSHDKLDTTTIINGTRVPSAHSMLSQLDWDWLTSGYPGRFHGDFHFENIIVDIETEAFFFIDWRQDYGGDLAVGDVYYDLAKLLHGMIVSHKEISADHFRATWSDDNNIEYSFNRPTILKECELKFARWCTENDFDFSKVQTLTALIFLNIAPLHHYPYSILLFALGKTMLFQEVEPR